MGLDCANFVYNTGSISFILVVIIARTLVLPAIKLLIKWGYNGPGRIWHKMDMEWDDVIGTYVRMWHEQFITFIQAGLVAYKMLTLTEFTGTDNLSFYLGWFVLPITVVYPGFLIWFSFYHVRRLVFIN